MAPPSAAIGTADVSDFRVSAPVSIASRDAAVPDNVLKGIGLIIASTLFFSAGDVAAKMMTASLPALEITWFRYLIFAILVIPITVATNGRRAFTTNRRGLQIFRAIGIVGSSVFFIMGLEYMQPAEATAINFISPLFITFLSIPFLGEKVGLHRAAAAGVGFLGVMLIVRPGSDAFQLAALLPVGCAVVSAAAMIATRKMTAERPEVTMAWTGLVGFIGLSIAMAFVWRTPDLRGISLGVLTGVLSTAGHWLVVKAYRLAPASVLAPFSYAQLVFAGFMGFIAFGVTPGPWTLFGGIVIATSGLYTAQRETARSRHAR